MDAFISLYDTAVNDRGMLNAKSWWARLLYSLERRAFDTADVVLVDTDENAAFYAELFKLDPSRFVALPLAIPHLERIAISVQEEPEDFICLFMGSMVPLQGVETILGAIKLLAGERGLNFVIIGDGQQGYLIQEFLQEQGASSLVWYRGFLPTEQIMNEINRANLCLGIFGTSEKADRVFPYKLYYYSAMGKPFITRDSACLRRVAGEAGNDLLCGNDAQTLASRIKLLYRNRTALAQCASASALLYHEKLSKAEVQKRLLALLAGYGVVGTN
jgi:glycosyltransferase involved in cell wall biosynthesis